MLVMRTTEDPTDPVGKLVSAQQTVGLDHLPLAVHPLGLYGVQPRALLRQKAAYDPHPFAALLDSAVMFSEPAPEFAAYVPAGVVPDEEQNLLANCFELLSAPSEKLSRYPAHGPTIHEPQPRLVEFRQVEPVTGDGLRFGIVFGDRLLDEAHRLSLLGEATQGRQSHPAPPALVLEAYCPLGVGRSHLHQSVAPPFFLSYRGSGEVIHRLALCQRTPRRCTRVARIVSPDPPFCEPLLEAHLCCQLKRPQARLPAELPRRAVEHLPQPLGALLVEGSAGALRARGARLQSIQAALVESVDGVAHRLGAASQTRSDLGRGLSTRTCQKYLASAQDESIFGA